jgi:hypothetical protein
MKLMVKIRWKGTWIDTYDNGLEDEPDSVRSILESVVISGGLR